MVYRWSILQCGGLQEVGGIFFEGGCGGKRPYIGPQDGFTSNVIFFFYHILFLEKKLSFLNDVYCNSKFWNVEAPILCHGTQQMKTQVQISWVGQSTMNSKAYLHYNTKNTIWFGGRFYHSTGDLENNSLFHRKALFLRLISGLYGLYDFWGQHSIWHN